MTRIRERAAVGPVRVLRTGISCNVIAGYHHDHLLVPVDRAQDALAVLLRLAAATTGVE